MNRAVRRDELRRACTIPTQNAHYFSIDLASLNGINRGSIKLTMPIAWTIQIINLPLHLASHVATEILIDEAQWLDVLDLEVELPYEIPWQEHLQSPEYLEEVILEA